jgi:hypothetical protein
MEGRPENMVKNRFYSHIKRFYKPETFKREDREGSIDGGLEDYDREEDWEAGDEGKEYEASESLPWRNRRDKDKEGAREALKEVTRDKDTREKDAIPAREAVNGPAREDTTGRLR